MTNHDYVKLSMVSANETLSRACDRYDQKAYRAAMHAALDSLVQYTDAIASFANDYPFNEHVWKELRKVSEYVERMKWEYVE